MIIGLSVVAYMLYKEWNPEAMALLRFTWKVLFYLVLAIVMMIVRDLGYMVRIRLLGGEKITWKKAFNIIMLWEFTSAITPSAIGGTGLAVYYVHKEALSVGKSTAVVMATSFLDELYFIIMFPLMFIVVSGAELFTIGGESVLGTLIFTNKYFYFAVIGYSIKFIWVLLMAYALFKNPSSVKKLLVFIFRFKWIRKWQAGAAKTGDDLIAASTEMKGKPLMFWIKSFIATFFAWNARYWIVNFLLLALLFGMPENSMNNEFTAGGMHYTLSGHVLIFARQLVMWIMMLVMPTPGGSGFAEAVFSEYMAEFIPLGFVVLIALLWRLVTYYPYLLIGVFIVPRWIRKVK